MNEAHQRMATVGTDKELSDLLDFSAVRKKLESVVDLDKNCFIDLHLSLFSSTKFDLVVRGYPFSFIPLRTDRNSRCNAECMEVLFVAINMIMDH